MNDVRTGITCKCGGGVVKAYTIGLDFGTSSLKGLLLDSGGQVRFRVRKPLRTYSPRENWFEQDPDDWWKACRQVLRSVFKEGNVRAKEIKAIGISGHGCSCLPVSREGLYLRRAIIWMDRRAWKECEEVVHRAGSQIKRANGNPVMPFGLEPKILWLKKYEPAIYKETYKFLTVTGYINMKLTGKFSANTADSGFFCAFDRHARAWSDEVCEALSISKEYYPKIHECASSIGEVDRKAARQTGLREGTLVVAGGEDTCSAPLGMGACEEGDMYYSTGSGSNVGICLGSPPEETGLTIVPHVMSNLFLVNVGLGPTGLCLDWFHGNCFDGHHGRGESCQTRQRTIPPGSGGVLFLPYMEGQLHPVLDTSTRGAFLGLTPTTKRAQMVQAIMEGCAFSLREGLQMLESVADCGNQIRISGGPAQNQLWNQINANVTGKILIVPEVIECEPLANAILAGIGAEVFADFQQAVKATVRIKKEYYPDPEAHELYDELYGIHGEFLEKTRSCFGRLTRFERM